MDLQELQSHWNELGLRDPLWAVVTSPEFRGGRWDATEFFRRGEKEIADVFAYLRRLRVAPRRRLALDFGCGVGRLSQPLCRRFLRVHGVDIAPSMLETARRFNRHPLRCRYFLNASSDLHALPSARYDFAISIIVLQHMQPPYAECYLHELVRVLAPHGVLIFQLPSEPVSVPAGAGSSATSPGTMAPVEDLVAGWSSLPTESSEAVSDELRPRLRPSLVERTRAFSRSSGPESRASVPRVPEPMMEMYGLPFERVLEVVAAAGAAVIDATHDPWAGPAWRSYRYCVLKTPDRPSLVERPPPAAAPE